jgi:c-di-GMP-binding flagellar brake protein YcgR
VSFDYGETAYRAVLNDLRILEKENERLRKALADIAVGGCECCAEGSLHRDEMIDTARAALEGME